MDKITNIEIQKRNKDRVNIYIDEEYSFSMSVESVYKEGLKINQVIDKEKILSIAKDDNYKKCKNSALKILERTYKTEKEIRDKLILKGYDEVSINKSIEFLKEYNFLSDHNFSKMYVKDKVRAYGKNKIKYDLIRKGIDDNLIEEAISNIDYQDEIDVAYNLAIKKYNTLSKREEDKFKLSQKLYRFLLSKGYNYDIVSNVVKRVINLDEF